jgi:hypothetical protein
MQNADIGFDKHQLLTIPMQGGLAAHYETLREEIRKHPGIESVSASTDQPFRIGSNSSNIDWQGKDPDNEVLVSFTAVDFNYATTMKIRMISGRDFSEEHRGDLYQDTIANWLINATMANMIAKDIYGDKDQTVDQEVKADQDLKAGRGQINGQEEIVGMTLRFMGIEGQVVGVMDDFHFKPLSNEVEPLVAAAFPANYLVNMIVRLRNNNVQPVLQDMEATWNSLVPNFPFEYSFVDEEIDNMYRSEQRMSSLIGIFTFVAIVIACMGLFALASFNAERRTREIGVRKTFGASEATIVRIMLADITRLVLFSLAIGLPATWLLARRWLQDFYYRIDLSADIFLFSTLLIILVSLATILYHALRSSRLNPVTALQYE